MSLKASDNLDNGQKSPQPWKAADPWAPTSQAPGGFPGSVDPSATVPASAHQSLSAAVKARQDEYIRKKALKIKIGTWNVASISGTEKDLGPWFVGGYGVKGLSQDLAGLAVETQTEGAVSHDIESVEQQEARMAKKKTTLPKDDVPAVEHDEQIDLYVLGLQEVIDVTSMTEAVRPYTDPNPGKKWKKALADSLPTGFEKVAEQQLLGLLILIYASPQLYPTINSVSTSSVGTGLMGYLGNKGAVAVRIMIGETTRLCFVNCHLAAGADQTALNRRIWDTSQVLTRTRFSPVSPDGEVVDGPEEKIGDEDFGFWFGDLNYRLDDIPGEDVRRLLLLHTRNEYDIANKSKRRIDSELGYLTAPSNEPIVSHKHYEYSDVELPASESAVEPPLDPKSDPASLHTTIQSLLAHDQLRAQQRLRKAFHEGWREGEINFLPTYKYDVGSVGMFDSGEKKRSPSWCDRVLFRTRRDREVYEEKAKKLEEARKKDEAMKARGIDEANAEQDVLFDYDPDTDGLAYGDECDEYDEEEDAIHDAELVRTREEYGDPIELNHYISHQRVLSSDHKPLDAIFTLTYDAVIPELKAKVHQEVARKLDKAENESRPAVTVVVDHYSEETNSSADDAADINAVQFGQVFYGEKKTRTVTVANTGQITATVTFVERPSESGDDGKAVPSWLELNVEHQVNENLSQEASKSPSGFSLSPGDTIVVSLTVDISDGQTVRELNMGDLQLDDVLVLRVTHGRDHFIPIRGTWLQSSFFRTLDELVLAPEGGVRMLRDLRRKASTGGSDAHHSAPKELFSLTETIPTHIERSVADWSMLHGEDTPPWQYDGVGLSWPFSPRTWTFHGEERAEYRLRLREALDTAQPLEESFDPDIACIIRLEVLAETLLEFLRSLGDGILTAEAWAEVEQRLNTAEKGKTQLTPDEIQDTVMDSISRSPVHSVSFTFITFMLMRIVNELVPCGVTQANAPAATSPNPSRRSRTSTLSSESGQTSQSGQETPGRRSLFAPLRRRRTQSISTSSNTAADPKSSTLERRHQLIDAYTEILAPLVIRSENDTNVKGRERKALELRKKQVLEVFLDARHV
ncbi:uncharacterized protein A1O9_03423 [Exophiala aquamarina CBS 119918]|uniref:Inositol polyphosphate-related phosphatase domain-containing protein n=1 Tax=Exophiala aquamarina CBS 119918 TaxID=1182545 RepID=A0A072PQ55_9EURO|nr:uncharacterized protein A1O9_03423 [Exophiala aquamarina CBS 119918]KEF61852.1 hypothetical protein A1O9_03423 [Exophiala aquamarina CBS 119918]